MAESTDRTIDGMLSFDDWYNWFIGMLHRKPNEAEKNAIRFLLEAQLAKAQEVCPDCGGEKFEWNGFYCPKCKGTGKAHSRPDCETCRYQEWDGEFGTIQSCGLTFITFTTDDKIEIEDKIFEFGECPEWEAEWEATCQAHRDRREEIVSIVSIISWAHTAMEKNKIEYGAWEIYRDEGIDQLQALSPTEEEIRKDEKRGIMNKIETIFSDKTTLAQITATNTWQALKGE